MYTTKSGSSLSTSSNSRQSVFSHCSVIKAAAGDFKSDGKPVEVKYTANTAENDNVNVDNCNRGELLEKIKILVNGIGKQERYLKHQEEKQRRNKQLISHLTSLTENDKMDTEKKKREFEILESQRTRFEEIILEYRKEVEYSSARHIMAQRLNDDLVRQKRAFEKRRDRMRRQELERGINDEIINDYNEANRLLEQEREKKQDLMKKMMWYEKEIAKIKKGSDKAGLGRQKSTIRANLGLPEIASKNANLVSHIADDEPVNRRPNDAEIVNKTKDEPTIRRPNVAELVNMSKPYVDEVNNGNFVPKPPEQSRSNTGTFQRRFRQYKPKI